MPQPRSSKVDMEAKNSSRKKLRYVINFTRLDQSRGKSNRLQVKESCLDRTGQNGISANFFLHLFLVSVSDLMMMMRGMGGLEFFPWLWSFFHGCG